jgi:hypothetical protein
MNAASETGQNFLLRAKILVSTCSKFFVLAIISGIRLWWIGSALDFLCVLGASWVGEHQERRQAGRLQDKTRFLEIARSGGSNSGDRQATT